MSGTKEGGIKTARTNREKYGESFYADIGAKGGRNGHTGGFAANRELASRAGAIGGSRSKRGKKIDLDKEAANIEQLRKDGQSITKIAEKYDVTYQTMRRYMLESAIY